MSPQSTLLRGKVLSSYSPRTRSHSVASLIVDCSASALYTSWIRKLTDPMRCFQVNSSRSWKELTVKAPSSHLELPPHALPRGPTGQVCSLYQVLKRLLPEEVFPAAPLPLPPLLAVISNESHSYGAGAVIDVCSKFQSRLTYNFQKADNHLEAIRSKYQILMFHLPGQSHHSPCQPRQRKPHGRGGSSIV